MVVTKREKFLPQNGDICTSVEERSGKAENSAYLIQKAGVQSLAPMSDSPQRPVTPALRESDPHLMASAGNPT